MRQFGFFTHFHEHEMGHKAGQSNRTRQQGASRPVMILTSQFGLTMLTEKAKEE